MAVFQLRNVYLSLILIVILFNVNVKCQLAEGSACFHKRSKSAGTCIQLDNCIEAKTDLLEKDITPQTCGLLSDNKYIVCCRNTVQEPPPPEVDIEPRFLNSKYMCQQYAKTVYTTRNPFNVPGSLPTNHSQCGFAYRPLIYGGELAKGKEFPHMALIGYDGKTDEGTIQREWGCGGSLISDQWILTAAHCVTSFQHGDAKYVRLGELDYGVDTDDAKPEDFTVIQNLKHPRYSDTHYNDIGLLKLHKKVIFNAYIRPACLWQEKEIKADRAIVSGWGSNNDVFVQKRSTHLQLVTLSIIPESECNPFFQKKFRLEEGIKNEMQICAGARKDEQNKDACHGDSGGPIQVYATDFKCMYYIIGVTSFGKPCGLTRSPGVYIRVSPYLSWIEDMVWRQK